MRRFNRIAIALSLLAALVATGWWWLTPYRDPRLVGTWVSDPDPDTNFREHFRFSPDGTVSDRDDRDFLLARWQPFALTRTWEVRSNELCIIQKKDFGLRWGSYQTGLALLWDELWRTGRVDRKMFVRRFELVGVTEDHIELRTVADNHRPAGRVVILRREEEPAEPQDLVIPVLPPL